MAQMDKKNAPDVAAPSGSQASSSQDASESASADDLKRREAKIRVALTLLRAKGLRDFRKYPPEPWEPPLTEEEKAKLEKR